MTPDELLDKLKRIFVEDLDLDLTYEDLDPGVPLFEGGLALDSVVAVELIGFLEKRFDLELQDEMLTAERFRDLSAVAQLVQEQLAVRQGA